MDQESSNGCEPSPEMTFRDQSKGSVKECEEPARGVRPRAVKRAAGTWPRSKSPRQPKLTGACEPAPIQHGGQKRSGTISNGPEPLTLLPAGLRSPTWDAMTPSSPSAGRCGKAVLTRVGALFPRPSQHRSSTVSTTRRHGDSRRPTPARAPPPLRHASSPGPPS